MRSKSIVPVLVVVFGTLLWALVKDTYLSIALEEITQRAADYLKIPRADMIAAAAPYVLSIGVIAATAIATFRLGKYDRKSFQPAPDIDPRLAFQRILEHKSWLKKNTENDPEKRKRLVSDYLEIRLDGQMHAALAQNRIIAWGHESRPGTDGPFDKIPASKWHEIEISFLPVDNQTRAYAIRRRASTTIAQTIAYVGLKLNAAQVAKEFSLNRRVFR
jgi:hypothetical protein